MWLVLDLQEKNLEEIFVDTIEIRGAAGSKWAWALSTEQGGKYSDQKPKFQIFRGSEKFLKSL